MLVVGLDGASFRLIGPWLAAGELPCLSRLWREGVRGPLESVTPPLSPEAWSTFMTGKHPGLHGVMNFLRFRPNSYQLEFSNGSMIRAKTLWRMLSEAGRRVGVMGVPMTYPPEPVNGYLVSGIETPGLGSRYTHPEGLAKELREALGGYDLHGDFADTADPSVYLERLIAMVGNQAGAARYLLGKYPADLSVVVFGVTDRVHHSFWRYHDPEHPWHDPGAPRHLIDGVRTVYRRVDDAVAQLLEEVPGPTNVVVMSDHGCGPCHTLVDLNGWLAQRGYLNSGRGEHGGRGMVRGLYGRAAALSPRWLKDAIKARLPGLRSQLASMMVLGRIDWGRTRAFSISTQHGYIYLNRRDRFPLGLVEPGAEADGLCARLAEELVQLREPEEGKPLVERVVRTRDLYHGPACDTLPDLIVLWREGYIARVRSDSARTGVGRGIADLLKPTGRALDEWSASHRPDGMLIAHGPAFVSGASVEGARLVDLAPTLLHVLGEPVPEDMTGRVLEELLDPGFLRENPVRYSAPDGAETPGAPTAELSPEESEEVAERLRKMGYL
ncbi:MAG: alkaline phosphatase family protein [Armatimonadota bacterium]